MHLTGRVYITVKGQRLRSEPGASLKNAGGLSREGVAADTGVGGYVDKVEIPEISCSLLHGADIGIEDIRLVHSAGIFKT